MQLADRFYEAFAVGDWHTMALMYAPHARFSDPIFPDLDAAQVRAMWQMLLSRSQDFSLRYNAKQVGPDRARIVWIADYTFARTGRPVSNRVVTDMQFAANRIVAQVDRFSFWRWSRQALGLTGTLFGWTPMLRAKVSRQAVASLRHFMARELAREQVGTLAPAPARNTGRDQPTTTVRGHPTRR